jgi:hypothetical protein
MNSHTLTKLRSIITEHRGAAQVRLVFDLPLGRAYMGLGDDFLISASPKFAAKVNELLQTNSVKFIVGDEFERLSA